MPTGSRGRFTRRRFLEASAAAGALAMAGPLACGGSNSAPRREEVVVIGAGLAGLACAHRLAERGVDAAVFEARPDRVGGRCFTARGFADGQVGEHGGEFIDTTHRRLRALVAELGLELEDREAAAALEPQLSGRRLFDERLVSSAELYSGYGEFMRALAAEGKRTGYDRHFGYGGGRAAIEFDQRTALDWLKENLPEGIDSLLGQALQAYLTSEFGLDPSELAATSLLYLLEGNASDEDGSDERFWVAGGNDQVTDRLADGLAEGTLELDAPLVSLWRRDDRKVGLEIENIGEIVTEQVVLALPFTTLREVDLEQSGLSALKLEAIRELGMGTNSKVLVQFERRPGFYHRWNGNLSTSHPFQYTWDTSLTQDGRAGLVTIYSGGADGAGLDAPEAHGPAPEVVVDETLAVLDEAVPGIGGGWNGEALASNWSEDPWARGSYAAFGPGQTTKFGLVAGQAEGPVHFAGEHTSTNFQGFLEGACESGERCAREVLSARGGSPG